MAVKVISLDVINSIKATMLKSKALGAAMSGSGSAVFGVFLTEKKALACAEILKKEYTDVFVVEPVSEGVKITNTDFSE